MTEKSSGVQLVDAAHIDIYPISSSERLDSHFFVPWNLKRWRGSEFRRFGYADPEVGWFGIELFFLAQDETPIGTLPCSDDALAFLLRIPPARWRELNSRDVSPLHGWRKVHCDNGEIRLAHSVVTEVAIESLESKKRNLAIAEQRRLNKRLADLRNMIDRIGAKQLLERPHFIERFNEWLEKHYAGFHRREGMVRTALDQFIMETENAQ